MLRHRTVSLQHRTLLVYEGNPSHVIKNMLLSFSQDLSLLRGRPLMIWGGAGGNREKRNLGGPSPGKKNLKRPSPGKN